MEHWIKKSHQQSQQSDQQQPVAEQRNGAGWLDGYAKMPQQAWSNFRLVARLLDFWGKIQRKNIRYT